MITTRSPRMRFGSVALAALLAACGPAKSPSQGGASAALIAQSQELTRETQEGTDSQAVKQALALLQASAESSSLEGAVVALDALFTTRSPALAKIADRSGAFYRLPAESKVGQGTAQALAKAAEDTPSETIRGVIQERLFELAVFAGREKDAATAQTASGCVREAWVTGPLHWDPTSAGSATLGSVRASEIASTLPESTDGPLGMKFKPAVSDGHGCEIHLAAASAIAGAREAIIDLVSDKGAIGVSLTSKTAATVTIDGFVVLVRSLAHSGMAQQNFSRVELPKGRHRVVVHAALFDAETVTLSIYGAQTELPKGKVPAGKGASIKVRPLAEPVIGSELSLTFQQATGHIEVFESLRADARPGVQLLVARSLEASADLSAVEQMEALRLAYGTVLKTWPRSWEAAIGLAVLDGRRTSTAESNFASLKSLEKSPHAIAKAYASALASRENLEDLRKESIQAARTVMRNSAFLEDLEQSQTRATGGDFVDQVCGKHRDFGSEACHAALLRSGRRELARTELERLAKLLAAPRAYAFERLRDSLLNKDASLLFARTLYDQILPGERTLSAAVLTQKGTLSRETLRALISTSENALASFPALMAAQAANAQMREDAVLLVQKDVANPEMKDGGTVILKHSQDYDLGADGLLHYTLYDLRRVSGTQDVESNAQVAFPSVFGIEEARILKQRVLKRDGRIVEPDATPNASQDHAALSQLEAGDYVEALYEGWALPDASWRFSLFGPDLLPERTSIVNATVQLRVPEAAKLSMFAHPLLGKKTETTANGLRTTRYQVERRSVRRLEPGTPRQEDTVGIAFTSETWDHIAETHRAAARARSGGIADVSAWAHAQTTEKDPQKIAEAITRATGKAVKTVDPSYFLMAAANLREAVQEHTARTMLATKEGSRVWLAHEALRTFGIASELVLTEVESWSDAVNYPPTFGRFRRPLLRILLATGPVFADLDVSGPPLPMGRVSPELRGRKFLQVQNGQIAVLPMMAEDTSDEVALNLTLDENGNARGEITVLLRGRVAQELSEALVHTVGVERDKLLRGVLLAWVPYATVDDIVLSSAEDAWQIALRAGVQLGALGMREGTSVRIPGVEPLHLMGPRPYASTLASLFGSQGDRQTALSVNRPTSMHIRRRVEVPKGTLAESLPRGLALNGDLLRNASRTTSFAAGKDGKLVLEDDFKLDLISGTVAKESFERFMSELRKVDSGFLTDSVLLFPSAQTKPGKRP
jgi:hypothetical protein